MNLFYGIFLFGGFLTLLAAVYGFVRFIQESVKVRKKRNDTDETPPATYLLLSITCILTVIVLYLLFGDAFKSVDFSQAKITLDSVLSGVSLLLVGLIPLIIIWHRCRDDEDEQKHEEEKRSVRDDDGD